MTTSPDFRPEEELARVAYRATAEASDDGVDGDEVDGDDRALARLEDIADEARTSQGAQHAANNEIDEGLPQQLIAAGYVPLAPAREDGFAVPRCCQY